MKKKEQRYRVDQRTLSREASCVDTFSKLEALFLEKFFRFNLSDYFSDTLISLEDHLRLKRLKNRQLKQLAAVAFVAQAPLTASTFAQRLDCFYR
jgi:hypothetical protein